MHISVALHEVSLEWASLLLGILLVAEERPLQSGVVMTQTNRGTWEAQNIKYLVLYGKKFASRR